MIKLFFGFFVAVIIISSCANNTNDNNMSSADSVNINPANVDSISTNGAGNYLWIGGVDEKSKKLLIKKSRLVSKDSLSTTTMIGLTNNLYPEVKLQFIKISGDTIYVKIPQSTYLTQQMGTTGAEMYMANATFNLTELPGIHYVNFDFEEGDHAGPTTLSRENFMEKQAKGF